MGATLRDVAALAGVSVKTVSNVVNGYSFVGEENRRRVEEALASTGYRPNLGARNLRRGRTGFLALVLPDLGIPYFGDLAALVVTAAQEVGWNVLIQQTRGERTPELDVLDALGPHVVDGAILSPEGLQAADYARLPDGFPVVLLGEQTSGVGLDHVGIDNVGAARTAVEHLIGLGRRRIAVIGDNPHRGTAGLRLQGYRDALAAAGLPAASELVASAPIFHRHEGALAMRRLLETTRGAERPDAVFCLNDLLAVGALHEAVTSGLRVPDDLAIVGFDGSEESAYSLPALSTIAPDKQAIATEAVRLLHARREPGGRTAAPADVTVAFRLEARASTAPAV